VRNGDIIADRFRVVEKAGSGGMGTVYRGVDLTTNAPVAIKVLRRDAELHAERFRREAAVLSRLSHVGIVRHIDHGVEPGSVRYLVQEWINGSTLHARMQRVGLSAPESLIVGTGVAWALAEAHRHGVVHRDIKPTNLMLENGDIERVKVLDFGTARRNDEALNLTLKGSAVGTPGYMAPEQVRGNMTADARADVFALGCVLYECLTGMRAFPGQSELAVRAKIAMSEPPPVRAFCPEAGDNLAELVHRMLAKNPDRRPTDGAETAALLQGVGRVRGSERRRLGQVSRDEETPAPAGGPAPFVQVGDPWTAAPVAHPEAEELALGSGATARELCCVVMASGAQADVATIADAPGAMDEKNRETRSLLAATGGRVEIFADGTVIVSFRGIDDAHGSVRRAAQAALALARVFPGALVAMSSGWRQGEPMSGLETAIDTGSMTLEAAEEGSVAMPAPGGAVQLDQLTARLLSGFSEFEVVSAYGSWFLRVQ